VPCSTLSGTEGGRRAGFAFALYLGLRSDPEGLSGRPDMNDALFNVAAGDQIFLTPYRYQHLECLDTLVIAIRSA
jgi:hypothetical protein